MGLLTCMAKIIESLLLDCKEKLKGDKKKYISLLGRVPGVSLLSIRGRGSNSASIQSIQACKLKWQFIEINDIRDPFFRETKRKNTF